MKNRPVKKFKPVNPATVLLVKQFVIGFSVFCALALLVAGVWHGTRLSAFTISAINVSGGETISASAIHSQVEEGLTGTYLGIIPKRFSWFYPREAIISSLEKVERLKDVEVVLLDKKTLEVSFAEYLPDALWCLKEVEETCLFLDETGYAFASAPNLSGNSLVRYYSLSTDAQIGARPLNEADYQVTKQFTSLLRDSNWFVSSIEVDSAGDAFYVLEGDGEIKVGLASGALKPFTYLQSLLGSEQFKHLQPDNFKYLDLRFGTKIFVNEEIGTTTEATVVLPEGEVAPEGTATTSLDEPV